MSRILQDPELDKFIQGASAKLLVTWMTKDRAEYYAQTLGNEVVSVEQVDSLDDEINRVFLARIEPKVSSFVAASPAIAQIAERVGVDRAELSSIAASKIISRCRDEVHDRVFMQVGANKLAENNEVQAYLQHLARLKVAGDTRPTEEMLAGDLVQDFAERHLQLGDNKAMPDIQPLFERHIDGYVAEAKQWINNETSRLDQADQFQERLTRDNIAARQNERAVCKNAIEHKFDLASSKAILALPRNAFVKDLAGDDPIKIRSAALESAKSIAAQHKESPIPAFQPAQRPDPKLALHEDYIEQHKPAIYSAAFYNAAMHAVTNEPSSIERFQLNQDDIARRGLDPQVINTMADQVHAHGVDKAAEYFTSLADDMADSTEAYKAELNQIEDIRADLDHAINHGRSFRELQHFGVEIPGEIHANVLAEASQAELDKILSGGGDFNAVGFADLYAEHSSVHADLTSKNDAFFDGAGKSLYGQPLIADSIKQDFHEMLSNAQLDKIQSVAHEHFKSVSENMISNKIRDIRHANVRRI
ncbi:hypothetical protein CU669_16920 [Paramagnetospirillum kuznetsovii]|uniref:Uncharacterized protein n=2 Tax=Paramagnetospirillum kuznetsovii TaxID=2053833 RepID=A0A364NUL5_9PROT|nr:hypothetical protein CU669_16920 [Paramagnetospirillum kuznetsovii]